MLMVVVIGRLAALSEVRVSAQYSFTEPQLFPATSNSYAVGSPLGSANDILISLPTTFP